jgi:hypothetical protein
LCPVPASHALEVSSVGIAVDVTFQWECNSASVQCDRRLDHPSYRGPRSWPSGFGARNGTLDTQNVTQDVGKAHKYCLLYISAGKARRRQASVSALSNNRGRRRGGGTHLHPRSARRRAQPLDAVAAGGDGAGHCSLLRAAERARAVAGAGAGGGCARRRLPGALGQPLRALYAGTQVLFCSPTTLSS